MDWMISAGVLALALPYFYLLLLVNLNRDENKRLSKELFSIQCDLNMLEFKLNSVGIKASLIDIEFKSNEIEKINEEIEVKIQ